MTQEPETLSPQSSIPYAELPPQEKQQRLKELAAVFLKLGTIAFGGPAAHVAMMDDEVVRRCQWMPEQRLLDLLGVTSLIPGPNSTEMAILIGNERAGWRGLITAGVCFIFPAMLMVWGLAMLYVRSQTIPQVEWVLYGVKPVILAVIAQALWKLGKKAIKDIPTAIAGAAAIAAYFLGLNEILVLVLAGLGIMLLRNWRSGSHRTTGLFLLPVSGVLAQVNPADAPRSVAWGNVFLFFLKVGAVLYGSGYVLLAFLQRDLVERWQVLSSQQLLDAIVIGEFTPGPVFTTATFIGYLLAGHAGAIAATLGIFLPSFILVAIISPFAANLRQSRWMAGFLDGVNAGALGLMAAVTVTLLGAAIVDWITAILAILSLIAVFRFKVNSAWLVLAGAVAGFAVRGLGVGG
jgi:chromate transporter